MDQEQNKGGCLVTLVQAFAWLVTSVVAVIDMLYIRQAVLAVLSAIQVANRRGIPRCRRIRARFFCRFWSVAGR